MKSLTTWRSTGPILLLALIFVDAGLIDSACAQDAEAPPRDAGIEPPNVGFYPQPDAGYVTDLANLLSREEEEQIERRLWQTESRTGVEMAVVTVNSIKDFPGTRNDSIETFATGLFNAYGIGNLPRNDGVLLLVAMQDHDARIELGAFYGRRRDADARRIMDRDILPHFRRQDYAKGIAAGVDACLLEFAGIRFGPPWMLIGGIFAVPVLGLIAVSLFRNGKRGWGWVCVGLLIVLILAILKSLATVVRHLPESSSDSWSSGGFGGGFGGGFSGGGGASGSW